MITDSEVRPEYQFWYQSKDFFNLKKVGSELVGPCPNCGGTDRFAVRHDGIFNCRHCGDYKAIIKAAGWKPSKPFDNGITIKRKRSADAAGDAIRSSLESVNGKPIRDAVTIQHKYSLRHEYSLTGGGVVTSIRENLPNGKKTFSQSPLKKYWKGSPLPKPYDPDKQVIIVEGEKCYEIAKGFGLNATCWIGGTGSVLKTEWAGMAGRDVVLWPDNDTVGIKCMVKLAECLQSFGCRVSMVQIPDDMPPAGAIDNVVDAKAAIKLIKSATEWQKPEPEVKSWRDSFKLEPLNEFMQREIEKPTFLVDGLLRRGGFSCFHASPKTGKSELMRNLVKSVSYGMDFLNRKTETANTLYLAFEEADIDVQESFQRLNMLTTGSGDVHIHIGRAGCNVLDILPEIIADLGIELVICDTMLKMFPNLDDLNNYAVVGSEIEKLRDIARVTMSHILVIHHSRKTAGDNHSQLLGSTAIAAEFDVISHLTRTGQTRFIEWQGRNNAFLDKTELKYDSDTGAISLGKTSFEDSRDDVIDSICECLKDGDWQTQKAIRNSVSYGLDRIKKALEYGTKEGIFDMKIGERNSLNYRMRPVRDT